MLQLNMFGKTTKMVFVGCRSAAGREGLGTGHSSHTGTLWGALPPHLRHLTTAVFTKALPEISAGSSHKTVKWTACLRAAKAAGLGLLCFVPWCAFGFSKRAVKKSMVVTGNSGCLCGDTNIYALHRAAAKNTPEIKTTFLTRNSGWPQNRIF